MKKYYIPLISVLFIVLFYIFGPRLKSGELLNVMPDIQIDILNTEQYVADNEAKLNVMSDNEARIIWNNDSLKNKTTFSMLYLHGFTACWYEGYPTHINLAKTIGANLYLSRLHDHGIETDNALLDMEPSKLYESAKEALLIAASLGEKVIVVGTSTGGTLALKLAADFPDLVNVLVLLSPNIRINNPAAFMLPRPWGLQVARFSGGGGKYRYLESNSEIEDKYWNQTYRWEAAVYLGQLIEKTMNKELFKQIKQPLFLGYYYKNDDEQDPVVRVDAMLKMFDEINTPVDLKYKIAFPEAGRHVIACEETSGCVQQVENEILIFLTKVLQ